MERKSRPVPGLGWAADEASGLLAPPPARGVSALQIGRHGNEALDGTAGETIAERHLPLRFKLGVPLHGLLQSVVVASVVVLGADEYITHSPAPAQCIYRLGCQTWLN